ncbi:MAG: ribonuclease H-like domain-containing protein [Candidatus Eisenbacteria bacterium]
MEESLYRRRLSDLARGGRSAPPAETGRRRGTPSPLPAGRVVESSHGAYYLVEEPLEQVAEESGGPPLAALGPPWRLLAAGKDGDREAARPLFFDLETTGFTSTPLFLAATIDLDAGIARQRFARDYTEERGVIAALLEEIEEARTLVSYNGRSYDVPFLRNRAAYHRLPFTDPGDHLDLLHLCRRRWRERLPDFRLQTVEKLFGSGAPRAADIPGEEIPALYHAYVRRGFDPRMRNVFRHNMRDVVTLVRIFLLLAGGDGKRRDEK